jgi:excisionase family DNA binding protein
MYGDRKNMEAIKRKDFYTVPELARLVCLSKKTLYVYVRSGRLRHTRYGSQIRITPDEWQEFMMNNNQPK